ncbi:MAG: anhydro-N-acetylmuramic acid kinase [Planctomycetes bacterium]|nr:anhydro-N-acetylmuramic acid kinase [Planctomycetota bacterium]MCP4770548.1 anhydro-N-acetylmuramic acid kinase [Planctomycetota bacterium]MCP4860361.1 anhydro-N-acetylmuramic acid kinase [Planctomycetota bacterium]
MPSADPERPRHILGINSGTSADGVDLALIRVDGRGRHRNIELLHSGSAKFPLDLQRSIHVALSWTLADVARFHHALGVFFGRCARDFLAAVSVPRDFLTCLGSHGQTVFHHSGDPKEGTLQLGCLSTMAATAGISVVGDFRSADIARGGQGAPISPFADWVLHSGSGKERTILNMGGISNITLLPSEGPPVAWDSGPANGPLDALMRAESDHAFDRDGELARSGQINESLLTELQADPYFALAPPKSTGLELFGANFVAEIRKNHPQISLEDLLATLVELVAWSVSSSLKVAGWQGGPVYMCGGGAHNLAIREALDRHLGVTRVFSYQDLGWNPDFREAVAFALLADAFLLGEASTWPTTTGASAPAVLGVWSPAGIA